MRVWAIVACVTLGFAGVSSAKPLDSPGTVYIDGLPCNVACQSYMAWSRQTLKATRGAVAGTRNASVKAVGEAPRKPILKQITQDSVDAPPKKKTADLQAALTTTPEPPPLPRPRTENAPHSVETREPSRERTPKEYIMAALAVAEQITKAETPKSTGNDGADGTRGASADVVLLISRSDVKSAFALNGLSIAIDTVQSGVEKDIRSALVAAGVAETLLSFSNASPLDRLFSGEVPAAVLNMVSPGAAEAFPEIKGFRVLRFPLSAR
jgi:hypothetical protein